MIQIRFRFVPIPRAEYPVVENIKSKQPEVWAAFDAFLEKNPHISPLCNLERRQDFWGRHEDHQIWGMLDIPLEDIPSLEEHGMQEGRVPMWTI